MASYIYIVFYFKAVLPLVHRQICLFYPKKLLSLLGPSAVAAEVQSFRWETQAEFVFAQYIAGFLGDFSASLFTTRRLHTIFYIYIYIYI